MSRLKGLHICQITILGNLVVDSLSTNAENIQFYFTNYVPQHLFHLSSLINIEGTLYFSLHLFDKLI